MKEESFKGGKVYYGFTPHIDPYSIEHVLDKAPLARASIAMIKVGDCIHYGFTICSEGDNFSRVLGRQQAHKRLALGMEDNENTVAGYNYFNIPPHIQKEYDGNDHELSLYFLNSIVEGLAGKIAKTQRKIGETRKELESRSRKLLS